jgi:hypothetical protein
MFRKKSEHLKKSHMYIYLQRVHNNCAKFGESRPKIILHEVRTVYSKHAGKITKLNYVYIFQKMSEHFQKVTCTSLICP